MFLIRSARGAFGAMYVYSEASHVRYQMRRDLAMVFPTAKAAQKVLRKDLGEELEWIEKK